MTISDFEEWQNGSGGSMKHNALWAIKSYLRWAKVEHPLLEHSVSREQPPPQPFLKLEDVRALIEACDTSKIKGVQDKCIVMFLWETWARANGALSVTVDRVNLEDQEVTIHDKGGSYYTSGFGPDLRDLLEEWIEERSTIAKCDSLFINIRRGTPLTYGGLRSILEALGEKTGIRAKPHSFRRGGATHYANGGGNDRLGMVQGNWRSHSMYSRYTRSASLARFKTKRWVN